MVAVKFWDGLLCGCVVDTSLLPTVNTWCQAGPSYQPTLPHWFSNECVCHAWWGTREGGRQPVCLFVWGPVQVTWHFAPSMASPICKAWHLFTGLAGGGAGRGQENKWVTFVVAESQPPKVSTSWSLEWGKYVTLHSKEPWRQDVAERVWPWRDHPGLTAGLI